MPLERFDTTPYHSVPDLPLQTLVILARTLATLTPQSAPSYVDNARAQMLETAKQAEAAMIARLQTRKARALAADLALDSAVDGLWTLLCERIRGWMIYERSGFDFLLEQQPEGEREREGELGFATTRARADRAAVLFARLFGDGSLTMLERSYPEQAQLMANVLGLIDADGLEREIAELAGPELLPLLRRCQREYEAMIVRRSTTGPDQSANLRALRSRIRRRILTYAALLLTNLDESSPENVALIQTALSPMIAFRHPQPVTIGEHGVEVR